MFKIWSQDITTRAWTPRIVPAEAPKAIEPAASEACEAAAGQPPAKKARRSSVSGPLALLKKSLCSVTFRTAVQFDTAIVEEEEDGSEETISRSGTGLVIDAQAGFVLTDRQTVPQPLGDIEVTLGDVSRGASVWFVHPLHSFVVLRLDPDSSCKSFGVAVCFEERNFEPGEEAEFIGYDSQGQHFQARAKVQSVRLAEVPLAKGWRETNLEAVFLGDGLQQASGGVLCDARGNVNAIYTIGRCPEGSFGFCLPTYLLKPILDHMAGQKEKPLSKPVVPSLEVE